VRWFREERRLSQETVGHRAGMHPTYVGQVERGEKSPTIASVFKLSGALDVAPGRLIEAAERFVKP
jgi:transcriptional regulator with XRE-family HTH domain